MKELKNGSVDSAQTVKAGCGIRYDPEQLDGDCGFDFSQAENMKPEKEAHIPKSPEPTQDD
ncbi:MULTISPECIES: hypothetical protein [unclassified Oleiphilus]|jgi:hypothetical protein|uniref:hypothetical protein n=1 Tax=unclassified Oleiphilus TaxID=2631174 RepID=UPI0007C1FCF3|nr:MULTISPECIES: hypothetical protein [unclassified Oleiphilus]KZY46310.1 hypothetical protein A3732_07680 [Oleiphilus sp. HI0050]KZY79068.1 hypothetical protein A3740_00850 [Oleiphilus sp. HI0068]KZY86316.1 hypothetical protein A3741_02255 [Oleiphilus sp. HI0069]KZY88320.1 hypothetical protein A3743_12025 [Oleiphilus sp. HI0072]KZZ08084.1 hypothetical protein A3749_14715 [Oleiphilus sp. HI0078]KZZ20225.1 hypothetical protein A3752_12305 [Oleiphilus sp. HI0081]KZZ33195.1 hypothetical protein